MESRRGLGGRRWHEVSCPAKSRVMTAPARRPGRSAINRTSVPSRACPPSNHPGAVDAMDDPPVRTPARIGVLNQGACPLLHPPPHADTDLSTRPESSRRPWRRRAGRRCGDRRARARYWSSPPPRGLGRGLRFLPRPCRSPLAQHHAVLAPSGDVTPEHGCGAPLGQRRWRTCAATRSWAYLPALRASSETVCSSEAPPSSPSFAEIIDDSLKGVGRPPPPCRW